LREARNERRSNPAPSPTASDQTSEPTSSTSSRGARNERRGDPAPSPTIGQQQNYQVSHRLAEREEHWGQEQLLCECELVTRADFTELFDAFPDASLDDLRRQLRVGMGPCQGGFCSYRAAGIACAHSGDRIANNLGDSASDPTRHQEPTLSRHREPEGRGDPALEPTIPDQTSDPTSTRHSEADEDRGDPASEVASTDPSEKGTRMLRTFLEHRWIGLWPIAYGAQLRQAALDYWIAEGIYDLDAVPADRTEVV
jgi:glycerol-3-phosphate dehydrogenase